MHDLHILHRDLKPGNIFKIEKWFNFTIIFKLKKLKKPIFYCKLKMIFLQ